MSFSSADASNLQRARAARDGACSLTVNGKPFSSESDTLVVDLVESWCEAAEGIAVALNGEVVPRSEWASTSLSPGDRVEIVTAAAGG